MKCYACGKLVSDRCLAKAAICVADRGRGISHAIALLPTEVR